MGILVNKQPVTTTKQSKVIKLCKNFTLTLSLPKPKKHKLSLQRISAHKTQIKLQKSLTLHLLSLSLSLFLQNLTPTQPTSQSLIPIYTQLMEIPAKLLQYKFQFLFALILSVTLISLFFLAPRFLTILAYFWPLFLSTALFLFAVLVFGKTSPPSTDSPGGKAGEGLLDYVAGEPEHPVAESFKSEE